MAVRDKDTAGDVTDDGASHAEAALLLPPNSAPSLSPKSETTTPTMVSPASSTSPVPFVSLAEQTFTPLSMDANDFFPSDPANAGADRPGTRSPAVPEKETLLTKAKSLEQLRRDGSLSRSSSNSTAPTASAAGRGGATIVSAMVESFEALHAATRNANLGYELLRSKSQGQRPAGLASPPSTLSPSPSFSRSPSPSPAARAPVPDSQQPTADAGLGTAGPKTPVAGADEGNAAPQTAGATLNPGPSAAVLLPPNAHDASGLPSSAPSSLDGPPPTVVADAPLIRPTPSTSQPESRSRAVSHPSRPPTVHTSSTASLSLSHPAPDPDKLSQAGGFLGNIAALEATAERLSMTSSIEEAIREEHNELKRSESRRSSILRARARAASASDTGSIYGQPQLSVGSRQNSILGTNNAARSGGYSPGGYVMNPHHSLSAASGRLRSGSKASSIGMPLHIPEPADPAGSAGEGEHTQEFRFLPRHGPGKASTRSVASKLSLAQIAELEHPTALTQEVLDEADRAAAAGDSPEDDENIRASAHQFIEAEFAHEVDALLPAQGHGVHDEQPPRLQLHQPDQYQQFEARRTDDDRPTTSGSGTTLEQARAAFGDFDGVHCDPEADSFAPRPDPDLDPRAPPRHQAAPAPRPTSYFDPVSGQQMHYYPAPVPAMLNLPPKLSKKPKAPAPNLRRSQVVSTVPRPPRESRSWLPNPVEGLRTSHDGGPFMAEYLGGQNVSNPSSLRSGMGGETPKEPSHARHASEATIHVPQPPPEQKGGMQPSQHPAEAENRKSRPIRVDGLPPQLRASVFFDLPSEVPSITVKDGSAMDTLDSLLDASTVAPVSAFTDHVFAGKLGAEVYGPEKKRKVKKSTTAPAIASEDKANKRKTLVKRNSSGNLLDPSAEDKPKRKTLVKRNSSANLLDPDAEKKRASRFSLFGPKRGADDSEGDDDEAENSRTGVKGDAGSRGSLSPNQLAPDADEETEEESEEEELVYQGPPTTLLAELQLRKQHDKMRTRVLQHTHPDGMRSTLLELDAVAEVERKARHGKRVTLAWEDPSAVARQDSDDDEDVPLGMLFAAKAAGEGNRSTMDISAFMSEVHRPLGLLERREMEENEPLSRRRDRLQGKVPAQVPMSLSALHKRASHMPGGGPGGTGLRSQSRLTLPLQPGGGSRAGSMLGSRPGSSAGDNPSAEQIEPEIEGETLAARKARLAAENPLPRPRPVSGAFSSELLSQFKPDEDEAKSKGNTASHNRSTSAGLAAGKENNPASADVAVPEEEETLGQRRRRLQREREAREREMAFSRLTRAATPLGLNPNPSLNANTRLSVAAGPRSGPMALADVLGAHPAAAAPAGAGHPAVPSTDPRELARMHREAEAERHRRETELKMAALRAQMPTSLPAPNIGARTGGFMGGRFNDGAGGSNLLGGNVNPYPQQQQQQLYQQRASTLLGNGSFLGAGLGQGAFGGSTPNLGVYGNGVPAGVGLNSLPLQQGYGAGVQMGGAQGHMDMVERWRQGVMP
ncbi:c77d43ff-35e8-4b45-ab8f-e0d2581913d2 [Thermothielavioides terrestris]|uniref:C77d43ff-35e8-4b45-ab8f-e0d2581913d2 n=1 Tax=Thermothielavioides terrestris TaxID=2587410 RepID=A0A446BX48_9PEZI|nr:c77d43ff-35e8-4b45-ab8f-e0d2581913d2 [Thermothielavioides terrestris]